MGLTRTIRFTRWVDSKEDARYVLPGSPFGLCIEQAQIDCQMCPIIVGHLRLGRRRSRDKRMCLR